MDKNFIIMLGAFSGLAGALLTQLMTGLFSYIQDRRKQEMELKNQFRLKKLEIGENFYFINAELMTMVRKNIDYWQNLRSDRSEETLQMMKKEMNKLEAYQARLHTENWKFNLIGIYFTLPFTLEEMEGANRNSHRLFLQVTDLSHKIRAAAVNTNAELYPSYNLSVFDLCNHYQQIYKRMQENAEAIREQLLAEFDKSLVKISKI